MSRRDPDRAGAAGLAVLFLRVGVMNEMQYRVNFFVQLVQSLLTMATALVSLALVFAHTSELNGWTRPELLAVMGVFTIVGGLLRSVIQPNMMRVVEDVREGKLDFALTKPASAQLLVSVRDVRFWQVTDVLVGVIVLAIGLVQMDRRPSVADVAAFFALMAVGLVAVYCFWLILASASFWLVRMGEVQELFDGVYRAGQYPVGVYPAWLKYGLTFLVPLAFAITVPSEALTGRLGWGPVAIAVASAVVLVILSRWLWQRGLRRYGGASS